MLLASPDPGYNQEPVLDAELSDIIDWDRLSYLTDDDTAAPTCSFIDWEAEEECDVTEPRPKKKRSYNSDDSSGYSE